MLQPGVSLVAAPLQSSVEHSSNRRLQAPTNAPERALRRSTCSQPAKGGPSGLGTKDVCGDSRSKRTIIKFFMG
jgi:hypothetical protein